MYDKADLYSKNFVSICKAHKVSKLYVFGSVINGKFTGKSDLDFLVEIEENDPLSRGELLLSLWNELEDYCHRKVDLLTESSLKNPYLKEEIIRTRKLIYDGFQEKVL
jgi:predicted nucleotidyltransferase